MDIKTVGFVGLGVMGEAMCRNFGPERQLEGGRLRHAAGTYGAFEGRWRHPQLPPSQMPSARRKWY